MAGKKVTTSSAKGKILSAKQKSLVGTKNVIKVPANIKKYSRQLGLPKSSAKKYTSTRKGK